MENGSYIYKEHDFTVEDSFEKKKLLELVNHLGYIGGAIPSDEDEKKRQKRLIDASLLMESHSSEPID